MYTEEWEEYLRDPSPWNNKVEVWADFVKEPSAWIFNAEINHEIADLIYEKKYDSVIKYNGHIIMLYGFAVECYLKAAILKSGMNPISEDKTKLDARFKNHDLIYFHKHLFGSIDNETEHYLKKLRRGIESGKYPFETAPNKDDYKKDIDKTVLFCRDLIKKLKNKS